MVVFFLILSFSLMEVVLLRLSIVIVFLVSLLFGLFLMEIIICFSKIREVIFFLFLVIYGSFGDSFRLMGVVILVLNLFLILVIFRLF